MPGYTGASDHHRKLFSIRRGFTLIELLVVISITGLLVSLLLPALSSARASGRRMLCANHQKQLVLLTLMYADNFKGSAPWNTSVLTSHVPTWGGPTGASGPTNYLTRTGFITLPTDSSMSIRLCPELANTTGSAIPNNDYSHFEYNFEVVGYFRSYSSGATGWALPGKTAGEGPKRLHEFLRPTSVAVMADGKWLAQSNTVVYRGAQEFYGSTTRFRLGANSASTSATFAVNTVVGYRHKDSVNFGFVDGHVETRSRLNSGPPGDFGAIAEGD